MLLIVAVDTETGETEIFDRLSGTSLVDAVSASCAVPGIWPPVTINGRRYMDGGARSSDNADLALGYARTVIVSPMGTARPEITGESLEQQVETLKSAGGKTYVVEPDKASKSAIGLNPLAPETRAPAAKAGRSQGSRYREGYRALLAWPPSNNRVHSSRSNCAGSTAKARRAGIQVATIPTSIMITTAPARTRGSRDVAW